MCIEYSDVKPFLIVSCQQPMFVNLLYIHMQCTTHNDNIYQMLTIFTSEDALTTMLFEQFTIFLNLAHT